MARLGNGRDDEAKAFRIQGRERSEDRQKAQDSWAKRWINASCIQGGVIIGFWARERS